MRPSVFAAATGRELVTRPPSVHVGVSCCTATGARARGRPMPPLAPTHGEKSWSGGGGSQRRETTAPAGAAWQRSASFHGRGAEQRHQLLSPKQRPKTQPDLLAGVRRESFRSGSPDGETGRRTPSKVLVSVAVQRSMWPRSGAWRTWWRPPWGSTSRKAGGRRCQSADPAAFGLHYSQFSLESLDPREKVMELGSRSFFLCPKSSAAGQAASSSSDGANTVINREASGKAWETPNWLGYIQFWPMM